MGAAWARYPDLAEVSPEEARRIAERVREPWTRGGPRMASISEHRFPVGSGDVRVRRYDPGSEGLGAALIYLHGGGWTLFSLDTHDRLMREIAARARTTVFGVDYALSPEARYPVALEQVCGVARHLGRRGGELGVDASRIAIGGDSAGGNLAIAAALCLRDEGEPRLLGGLVLLYAVFERFSSPQARKRFGGPGNMLTSDEMDAFWRNYVRSDDDLEDPLVCPAGADLRELPPALLVVPECDLLAEQSLRMDQRLRAAGVPVELELYRGATHSFLEAVSIAPVADRALDDIAGWLRDLWK